MIASGGKAIYGASIGILMLEARFPRIPGDMGNALTWPFPVHYKVVKGASPDLVVRHKADGLLPEFIAAARQLVADGVDGITTNCGFLTLFQAELARALPVPVATSSLMQVPVIRAMLPSGKKVGILTISAETLSAAHLAAVGLAGDIPVAGIAPGAELHRVILSDEDMLDVDKARADILRAAANLCRKHPDVGAIVLECTNMVPYAADVGAATGLPVFSIYDFIVWFQSALRPRRFPAAEK